jgi:penicillin-binding protein 1A
MARPIAPDSISPLGSAPDPNSPAPVGMKWTRSGKLKKRNIVWRLRRVIVGVVAIGVLGTSAAGAQFWNSVELPRSAPPPEASYLCDATVQPGACNRETAFAEFGSSDAGVTVRYAQIPEVMVHALVAAEDKDFFRHQGVDPTGIARALWHDVRSNSNAKQGGSTLTQQLIKVVSADDSQTMQRKVREAVQAMKYEQTWEKEQILELYFNSIYYGRNAKGLDAAVRAYFGANFKVEDIKLEHAAYLAAIIREPELVDANRPQGDPKREKERQYATRRRADVLDAMVAQSYITTADRDRVVGMSWDYVVSRDQARKGKIYKHDDIGAHHWKEHISEWVTEHTGITKEALQSRGYRIYTSMDPVLQRAAYDAVGATLPSTPMWPEGPEASLASLDDQGYLRAMVGSRDPRSVGTNYATQGRKSPGSSFKPITLAQYLMTPGKALGDKYENPQDIKLKNSAGGEEPVIRSVEGDATEHPVDLIEGTVISSNTVYGQVQQAIKSTKSTPQLAYAMGIGEGQIETKEGDPRLPLGQHIGVSTLDMATVYSTLANRGERVGPTPIVQITNAKGQILWPTPADRDQLLNRKRVMPTEIADQVNYVLTKVVEDERGTGNNARIPGRTVAGKTGTVALEDPASRSKKQNSDAWFAGYSCKLSAAVWMGYHDNTAIGEVEKDPVINGGDLPAKIFQKYMAAATKDAPNCRYDLPPNMARPTTTSTTPTTTDEDERGRDRDRDRDRDRTTTTDRDDREETTTTRRGGPTFTLFPTTSEPDVTTTRRGGGGGPGGPTTTRDLFPSPN